MKKILVLLSLLVLATSCDWFVFDNQEYYNAAVEGKIVDSKTGEPMQFAFPNTCKISIIEEGWKDLAGNPAEESQSWYVPRYTPDNFDEACLNKVEKANLEKLLEIALR